MEDLNKAFNKKFGGNYKEKGKTHKVQDLDIYKNVKDFIRQREKELLSEAIKIFESRKEEPMTGNVVILELKVMQEELSNE